MAIVSFYAVIKDKKVLSGILSVCLALIGILVSVFSVIIPCSETFTIQEMNAPIKVKGIKEFSVNGDVIFADSKMEVGFKNGEPVPVDTDNGSTSEENTSSSNVERRIVSGTNDTHFADTK